eukprot:m.172800 g.172800  ORF g.172800 m.172800 type:complete len:185 (+) comp25224_c0_seq12:395-949(+)
MQVPALDLYQIHSPAFSLRSVTVWAEELAKAHKQGLIKHVGVSNYNSTQVRITCETLEKEGVHLMSNQIEYSLLHRLPETNGLIDECKKHGVAILAYSPLAMGRLTGKYTRENPAPSNRRFGHIDYDLLEPLLSKMKEIAAAHGDEITVSQVAINWVIAPHCGLQKRKASSTKYGLSQLGADGG